jgi:hypothetical protein
MRSESEVYTRRRTTVPTRAVSNAVSLIVTVSVTGLLQLAPAYGQAMRTYVSGTGKDGNPCTLANPCRTLQQAALGLTRRGGEIQSLDSADYGYVTIAQGITITGAHGATGVFAANVSEITISAGANDVVTLKQLEIDGAGSGANGIQFNSGAALNVQDSAIRGFANGISFRPTSPSALSVDSTVISNNTTGILFQTSAPSTGVLSDAHLVNNANGGVVQGASGASVASLSVRNGVVANNSVLGLLSNDYPFVHVSGATIANNGTGVRAQGSNAVLQLAGSTVSGNGSGWIATNGGQVYSPGGDNSIGGNLAANSAPPTSSTPPAPTFVAKNIVADFGARCDGVTDAAPAFAAFNTWARTQTLPVQLTIPSGSVCSFRTDAARWWAKGIKNLLVLGYGASIRNDGGGFQLGTAGVVHDSAHSARLATVNAGASSVSLLTASKSSLFAVGNYALIAGFDMMGYGYPINPHFFEYVQITEVDTANGVVTFSQPLKNGYKSTWPLYFAGNNLEADQGGPATLYSLDPSWDTTLEYRGLTIVNDNYQTYANGKSITYRDMTFTGNACAVPTQNLLWQAINTNMSGCSMEADKLVETMVLSGVTIGSIAFQSSSIDLLNMSNTKVTRWMNGTPKKAVISDSSIASFGLGTYAYGRTDEIVCNNCILPAIFPMGIIVKGPNDVGVNTVYTMQNGVIVIPNSQGPAAWAVPGTNLMWSGPYESETAFQVVDVSQDETNTYVKTSLSGGFPQVPAYQGTALYIRVHPAPKFTCNSCTGSKDALDLSQARAGAPVYSYSKRTYNGSLVGNARPAKVWGKLVSMNLDVATPYTGNASSATLNVTGQFIYPTIQASGAIYQYVPVIDLKSPGVRVLKPSSVAGQASGDSNLSVPEAVWFSGDTYPYMNTDLSSEPPAMWPTITVEITTDQGVLVP